jgi:hypothetical protein
MPVTTPQTTGSSFTGPSHGPYNSFGGSGNNTSGLSYNAIKKKKKPVPKEQVFRCVGHGLKPNTIHQFFYENVDRTKDCRQMDTNRSSRDPSRGRLGGPLTTDSTGRVEFNFYFTASVEREVDKLNSTSYNLAGDKVFELRAVDSTAKKIVPFIGKVYTSRSGSKSSSKSTFDVFGTFFNFFR